VSNVVVTSALEIWSLLVLSHHHQASTSIGRIESVSCGVSALHAVRPL